MNENLDWEKVDAVGRNITDTELLQHKKDIKIASINIFHPHHLTALHALLPRLEKLLFNNEIDKIQDKINKKI
jgi:hypothetical protein